MGAVRPGMQSLCHTARRLSLIVSVLGFVCCYMKLQFEKMVGRLELLCLYLLVDCTFSPRVVQTSPVTMCC